MLIGSSIADIHDPRWAMINSERWRRTAWPHGATTVSQAYQLRLTPPTTAKANFSDFCRVGRRMSALSPTLFFCWSSVSPRRAGGRGYLENRLHRTPLTPAKAGIQAHIYGSTGPWIPAFAGMSGESVPACARGRLWHRLPGLRAQVVLVNADARH